MNATRTNDTWMDDFTLALRLRSVRGDAIGDAVAVVREHLADSGETATEAFGAPRSYAAQLELPTVARLRAGDPSIMGMAVSLLALLAFVPAVQSVFAGATAEISLPQLLLFLVPVIAVVGLPTYFNAAVSRPWIFAIVFVLSILAATCSAFFAPERGHATLAAWNPWWAAGISGGVLLAASAWALIDALRDGPDDILDPSQPESRRPSWIHRVMGVAPYLLMPGFAVGCVIAEALIR